MKFILKSPSSRRFAGWTVAAATAFVLAACGGGGDDSPPSTTTVVVPPPPPAAPTSVPPSAVVDSASFSSYLNSLVSNDAQEPLTADTVTPPTSETGEPTTV